MKIYLARKPLFYVFGDDDLVTKATGWSKAQCEELSDQEPAISLSTATFENSGNNDAIYAVHDALSLLIEVGDISLQDLQEKIDEIELHSSGYLERLFGFLPISAHDYDLLDWARRSVWTPGVNGGVKTCQMAA